MAKVLYRVLIPAGATASKVVRLGHQKGLIWVNAGVTITDPKLADEFRQAGAIVRSVTQ